MLSATFRKTPQGTMDLAGEATTLPVEVERKGSKILAAVLVVLGVPFGVGAAMAIASVAKGGTGPLVAGGVFGVVSAALFIGAAHCWVSRHEWTFAADGVEHRWRGLRGWRQWTEPMAAYRGILCKEEYHSGGKNSPSYTLYLLFLEHGTDPKKTVQLYSSRSSEGFRAKHEHYARLFGLPVLIPTESGIQERAVEDLDKSVRQRVAEGTLEVTFDPMAGPPGARLAIAVKGDALIIWTLCGPLGRAGKVVGPILLLAGLGFAVGGPFAGEGALTVLWTIGGILETAGLVLTFGDRSFRQELLLSPKEMRSRWRTPFGMFGVRVVSANEVEEVVVRTPTGSRGFTMVQAIGDRATVSYGIGLTKAEKEWVRDCIVAVISK